MMAQAMSASHRVTDASGAVVIIEALIASSWFGRRCVGGSRLGVRSYGVAVGYLPILATKSVKH